MSDTIAIDELDDNVISDILDNMESEEPNDLQGMSAHELFDRFLIWNGNQGFTGMISEAQDNIRAAASIQEIANTVDEFTDTGAAFTRVKEILAEYGHMDNQTLKLISEAMDQGFAYRALALIKVKEFLP